MMQMMMVMVMMMVMMVIIILVLVGGDGYLDKVSVDDNGECWCR